jgi:hypothetical protein
MPRIDIPIRWLYLTKIVMVIPMRFGTKSLLKAFETVCIDFSSSSSLFYLSVFIQFLSLLFATFASIL